MALLAASALTQQQDEWTTHWHAVPPSVEAEGLLGLVQTNHFHNFSLWHEEDIARRDDLGFEAVYRAKRAIDRHNQLRNNAMEQIDQAWVAALQPPEQGVPFNSETPGMMTDRLSILALKIYHMREQAERPEAEEAHRAKCAEKLGRLAQQRADLAQALDELRAAVEAGTRSFRVYFQFKMYNDPSLNPQLYGAKAQGQGMDAGAR